MARLQWIWVWFTPDWWRYLIWGGWEPWHRKQRVRSLQHFICRARGHPCGPVWFNVAGLEPDMHCRECGDYCG